MEEQQVRTREEQRVISKKIKEKQKVIRSEFRIRY